MRRSFSLTTALSVLALTALANAPVSAQTLTFEGLQNLEAVNNFYNGGTGSAGSSGTNFGISFSSTSLAIIDSDAGGGGNFANEPSPSTILFFTSGGSATMNVAAGFTTGFSFFYSSSVAGSVTVYSGLNATGSVLATLPLAATPVGLGDPTGEAYGTWVPVGVSFAGTAQSVDFAGGANFIAFDNVTLNSITPGGGGSAAPEPGTLALLALGTLSGGFVARRRKA